MPLPNGTASTNQITYATGISTYLSQINLWDPAFALAADDAVYEKLWRDPVIAGAMDHLQRLVVGHDWNFEPSNDDEEGRQLAEVLEALTKQQRGFSTSLYNLARAHMVGATWGLIFPERRVLRIGDGKPREWTVVARVRDVDKRRFRLTQQVAQASPLSPPRPVKSSPNGATNGATPLNGTAVERSLDSEVSKEGYQADYLGSFRWEFHRGWDWRNRSSTWWQPLEAAASFDRWILYTPDTSERGLGYGYGMADDIYYYYWAKQRALLWGLQGLERWGQGFLYAKTKALRDQWAKGMSQSTALQRTVETLRKFRTENVAAVDENTELALLDMPATAEAAVRDWIDYFDREIVKRILAALQPTGGSSGKGSFSSAKVEEGSTDAMVAFLRSPLEETWTHSVAQFLIDRNQANLAELGLLDSARGYGPARLRLRGKETREVDDVVKVFTLARDLGMPVNKSEFYSWTGLSAPNDPEESITFAQPMMPGQPGSQGDDQLGGLLDQRKAPGALQLPQERKPVGEGGQSVAEVAEARPQTFGSPDQARDAAGKFAPEGGGGGSSEKSSSYKWTGSSQDKLLAKTALWNAADKDNPGHPDAVGLYMRKHGLSSKTFYKSDHAKKLAAEHLDSIEKKTAAHVQDAP